MARSRTRREGSEVPPERTLDDLRMYLQGLVDLGRQATGASFPKIRRSAGTLAWMMGTHIRSATYKLLCLPREVQGPFRDVAGELIREAEGFGEAQPFAWIPSREDVARWSNLLERLGGGSEPGGDVAAKHALMIARPGTK
jgi:hypothetical protein